MSVDASQIQSPANVNTSVNQGTVAPAPVTQAYQAVPGSSTPVQGSQPASQPQQGVAPQGQEAPVQQPTDEWRQRYEQEQQRRLQTEQEAGQLRGVVQQIQTVAQQQEQERQFNERMQVALAAADNMPADEARRYITQQTNVILAEQRRQAQQQIQQAQVQAQQMVQRAALPQYADHLATTLGLTPEAKQELLAYQDPDMMYRMAPVIKQRYDAFNQQLQALQGNQVQNARAQEVAAMQNAGFGAMGGQNVGGSFQVEIPDNLDPDERAMRIYNYEKYGPNWQPR